MSSRGAGMLSSKPPTRSRSDLGYAMLHVCAKSSGGVTLSVRACGLASDVVSYGSAARRPLDDRPGCPARLEHRLEPAFVGPAVVVDERDERCGGSPPSHVPLHRRATGSGLDSQLAHPPVARERMAVQQRRVLALVVVDDDHLERRRIECLVLERVQKPAQPQPTRMGRNDNRYRRASQRVQRRLAPRFGDADDRRDGECRALMSPRACASSAGTTRSIWATASSPRAGSTCARTCPQLPPARAHGRHARARHRHLGRLLGVRDGAPRRRGGRARRRPRERVRLAAPPAAEGVDRHRPRRGLPARQGDPRLERRARRAEHLPRDAGGARHVRPRLRRRGAPPPARPAARARAAGEPLPRPLHLRRRVRPRSAGSSRSPSRATSPTATRPSCSGLPARKTWARMLWTAGFDDVRGQPVQRDDRRAGGKKRTIPHVVSTRGRPARCNEPPPGSPPHYQHMRQGTDCGHRPVAPARLHHRPRCRPRCRSLRRPAAWRPASRVLDYGSAESPYRRFFARHATGWPRTCRATRRRVGRVAADGTVPLDR